MNTVVTQLKRGAPLVVAMTRDGMVDSSHHEGWMLMAVAGRGAEPHFQCFAPWGLAWEPLFAARSQPTVPTPVEDAIFAASLESAWGVLGLLSSDSQPWLFPKERHRPLLDAALAVWDELDAVGARYYSALQGRPLWSVPNNLHYVLANMGITNEVLNAPLPPGGLRTLLSNARIVTSQE